ncbi:uncharacterized protein EKO05_0006982 [Ascochyta rabiei]|uniref:uncharacterized protein n=1 Tax=Didymella rabiei TaxID=5454 RepID=UPI002203F9CB|nr:uncharacterized protein EKO05_0006982 [Ascochyta rabiei]UPX16591.1 hypothetical protein EKO05_0006982 [Ascochyta rabiei]
MTPYDKLTGLFSSGLASTSEPKDSVLLQPVNIELEELDHDGRRSAERRRKCLSIKPVAVRSFRTSKRRTLMSSKCRKPAECFREPRHLASYSFGGLAGPYGMSM